MMRMILSTVLVSISTLSHAQTVFWCYNQQNGAGPWITTINSSDITVEGRVQFERYPITFRSEEWVIDYKAVECCTQSDTMGNLGYYYIDMVAFNLLENKSHHLKLIDITNQTSSLPSAEDLLIRNCTQSTLP